MSGVFCDQGVFVLFFHMLLGVFKCFHRMPTQIPTPPPLINKRPIPKWYQTHIKDTTHYWVTFIMPC